MTPFWDLILAWIGSAVRFELSFLASRKSHARIEKKLDELIDLIENKG